MRLCSIPPSWFEYLESSFAAMEPWDSHEWALASISKFLGIRVPAMEPWANPWMRHELTVLVVGIGIAAMEP